jgi:protease I
MAGALDGQKVAVLVANEGVEQIELTDPWAAIEEAGGEPVLVSLEKGEVQAFNHLDKADVFHATVAASEARCEDYVGLVLPGGVANPDQLRTSDDAVRFAESFFDNGQPVAAICHAPWTLIEAGVLRDRVLTSWPSLQTDIRNAGGGWRDEEVVVCENGPNRLVTSRKPDDLEAFTGEMVHTFAAAAASEPSVLRG